MRMRSILLIAFVCLVVDGLIVVSLWGFDWRQLFHTVEPRALTVSPQQIDLGQLDVGQKKTFRVTVTNTLAERLELQEPDTQCGCLSVLRSPVSLAPGESRDLEFELTAPAQPEPFHKEIVLRSAAPGHTPWKIQVEGEAVADVWSLPPAVLVTVDRDGTGQELGTIKFAGNVQGLRPVASDPDQIQVELLDPGLKAQTFRVRVQSQRSGEGIVHFFSETENREVISVPVRWKRQQQFEVFPRDVTFESSVESPRQVTLTVVKAKEAADCALSAESLVPWLVVESIREESPRVAQITLTTRGQTLPEGFEGRVVAVQSETDPEPVYLEAMVK